MRFHLELTVADIMTSEVLTLAEYEDLHAAEKLMHDAAVRHLPVVDDEHRLSGLVTHRDVLRFSASERDEAATRLAQQRAIKVGTVMTRELVTARPDMLLADAARVLLARKIGCLPVVDGPRLVGIVTEADFVALTYRLLAHLDKGSEELEGHDVGLTGAATVPMVAKPHAGQEGVPMLELSRKQIEVFAGGLYTLASADGIDPREIAVIREFLQSAGAPDLVERLPELHFDAVDAYQALQSSWLRGLFLRAALLLVRSDGAVTEQERDTLAWMADVFGITGGYEALVAQVEGEAL